MKPTPYGLFLELGLPLWFYREFRKRHPDERSAYGKLHEWQAIAALEPQMFKETVTRINASYQQGMAEIDAKYRKTCEEE